MSPRPLLKAADRLAWAGTGCGALGMAAIWAGAVIGDGAAGPALIAGVICFAYALACYGMAAARRARLRLVERGMPGAMAVWLAAWYCERCDGVFFAPGAGPPGGVPAGTASGTQGGSRLLTPAAFRRLVWAAGGYGHLARAPRMSLGALPTGRGANRARG